MLVMDNLNTHHPLSLYEAFEPAEAQRIAKRLEIHYTPKHGELAEYGRNRAGGAGAAVLGPADTRPGSPWSRKTRAWQEQRNREAIRVDWRFTTQDARIKLKSLYPSIQ